MPSDRSVGTPAGAYLFAPPRFARLHPRIIRVSIGSLALLVALNAFGGGTYGVAGAKDVPVEWLEGTPFRDYLVPSLFLFFVVGGTNLAAAVAAFSGHPWARGMTALAGGIVLSWIVVQVAFIGYVSSMQPATALAGLVLLMVAPLLPTAAARRNALSS